ncbi:hypothetical protein Chor_002508 [Crotalus horridus]
MSSPMYHVERQVYNQGILHGQLHTKDKTTQPLGQKIAHALRTGVCVAGCSSSRTFAVISLMIGGVAVREVPDEWPGMTETNSTNGTDARDAMRSLIEVFSNITKTNTATLVIGLICIVLLLGGKEINDRFKKNLIPAVFVDAIAIALVGFSMTISMAKIFALKHGYTVDGNQTVLAAIVMVNLKGMFKQLADIAHFWRTSKIELLVQHSPVTVTPQYRILGQIHNTDIYCDVDLYTEVKECPGIKIFQANAPLYFANSELFTSALKKKTGVNPGKISAAKKKARKRHAKELKRLDEQRKKAILKMANDLERGMKHEVLENDVSLNGKFAAAEETPQNVSPEEVEHFMIRGSQVHSIILDFSPVNFVDSIIKEYEEIGVSVYITACNGSVMDNLTRLNFFEKTALWDLFFPSVHDAVLASQATGFSSTYL